MFALHTPQTVTLAEPGADGPFATLNFRTNGADTSRCVMELIISAGDMHRLTFTTRGALVDHQFISHDHSENDGIEKLSAEAYMVNGRDTRADNPYTHVAPVDADTAYRDGQTPGLKANVAETDEERETREKTYADADKAKRKLAEDAIKRREDQQKAAGIPVVEQDDNTHDGEPMHPFTGNDDRAPIVTDQTFPATGETRIDPLVPAPSTALPGGEPAHPQSVQALTERGKVNTTESMRQPAGLRPANQDV